MEKEKLLGLTVQQKQPDKVFNHVMLAIGRSAYTKNLGLEEVGVKCAKSGKIICQDYDRTSVENIFAIGDVAEGRLELTPSAIKAGKLLAHRLFNK